MIASVPGFLYKLARHRPRFVCFVGMVIWGIVRNSLVNLSQQGAMRRMEREKGREKRQMGLQTYKLVYGNMRGKLRRRCMDTIYSHLHAIYSRLASRDNALRRAVHIRASRTIPSLSCLVLLSRFRMNTLSQLSNKVALFTELQTLVRTPSSEIDTSGMKSVVLHSTSS